MMKNFWYNDNVTGEDFIVEGETREYADAMAKEYFEEPKLISIISYIEAEYLGFDTY